MPNNRTSLSKMLLIGALAATTGCTQDMADQPRYEPLEANDFFADGMASRPLVEGTVARGHLRNDNAFYLGTSDGKLVTMFPLAVVAEKLQIAGNDDQVTEQILRRGQQRFDIFCSPCHGRVGNGDGMVVQRGFPAPPSYHSPRLREAPVGHFYDVVTRGFGRMPSYAEQVPPADRWAIVAYLRALQLSQHAPVKQLSSEERDQLPGAE